MHHLAHGGISLARYSLMYAWFPYGHHMDDRAAGWLAKSMIEIHKLDYIGNYTLWSQADTPITMVRNQCLLDAEKAGYDFVLMLDNDNLPDYELERNPDAKPFLKTALEFAINHPGPCVVAAPYCGPPPHSCVYVFDWINFSNNTAQPDFSLEMVPRHEASLRKGFGRAAALATGVMLIDMRAIKRLKAWKKANPHLPQACFYYEWKDETESKKASTEDVVFTRDLSYAGIPLYAAWDSWAGHIKSVVMDKPFNLPVEWVPRHLEKHQEMSQILGLKPEKPVFPARIRERSEFTAIPENFPPEMVRQVAQDNEITEILGDEPEPVCANGDTLKIEGLHGPHQP